MTIECDAKKLAKCLLIIEPIFMGKLKNNLRLVYCTTKYFLSTF